MKVLVTQLCLTLCNTMDCSLPVSSIHGNSPDKNTGVGCHPFLQCIFPTLGSNPGLLHFRQILYHLSHQGSPKEMQRCFQRHQCWKVSNPLCQLSRVGTWLTPETRYKQHIISIGSTSLYCIHLPGSLPRCSHIFRRINCGCGCLGKFYSQIAPCVDITKEHHHLCKIKGHLIFLIFINVMYNFTHI